MSTTVAHHSPFPPSTQSNPPARDVKAEKPYQGPTPDISRVPPIETTLSRRKELWVWAGASLGVGLLGMWVTPQMQPFDASIPRPLWAQMFALASAAGTVVASSAAAVFGVMGFLPKRAVHKIVHVPYDDAHPYLVKAFEHLDKGEERAALEALIEARRVAPRAVLEAMPETIPLIGVLSERCGDLSRAESWYWLWSALASFGVEGFEGAEGEALRHRAKVRLRLGDKRGALEDATRVTRIDPKDLEARMIAKVALDVPGATVDLSPPKIDD